MDNDEFIFATIPSNKKKAIIVLISLGITLLLFLYFPFVPNLDYLKQVLPIVQKELGQVTPIILIVLFYSIFVLGFYWLVAMFWVKRVWISFINENLLKVFVDGEGEFQVTKENIDFQKGVIKNKITVNLPNKKIYLQNYDDRNPNYNKFKNSLKSSKKSTETNELSFKGKRIQFNLLISLLLAISLYAVTSYFYEIHIIRPYKNSLSILFRSKGTIFMILIRSPLIFLLIMLLGSVLLYGAKSASSRK